MTGLAPTKFKSSSEDTQKIEMLLAIIVAEVVWRWWLCAAALTLRSYPSTVSRCALLFRRENPANPTGRAFHFHQDPTSSTEHYNGDVQEAPSNCQSIRCQVRRTSSRVLSWRYSHSLNAHLHSSQCFLQKALSKSVYCILSNTLCI